MKYYSLNRIDKKNCVYNVIFGERSNGKTYALLKRAVENFIKYGKEFAYVRRWKEDLTVKRCKQLFSGLEENDEIRKLTDGEFSNVFFYQGKWFLCNYDESGKPIYSEQDVLGHKFAISDGEHDKSTQYPKITSIIFDEFLTAKLYLPDEFVAFMNIVSTIVRRREDVKIYMLGNTVNKYSPYFAEMGLDNILKMKQGAIDVYHYGNSELKVAVEFCANAENKSNQKSAKYFAFNNPKLEMITGGAWEMAIYPHKPVNYKPKDIVLNFFIEFADEIYHCETVSIDGNLFIYIHQKTTPIKDTNKDLVYSLEPSHKRNYNTSVFKPINKPQKVICDLFKTEKVFYQNNSVGDAIKNYLKICGKI